MRRAAHACLRVRSIIRSRICPRASHRPKLRTGSRCCARPAHSPTWWSRPARCARPPRSRSRACRAGSSAWSAWPTTSWPCFCGCRSVEELHYLAGQYLDVILSEGRRRSFSIASAPADGKLLELHVRKASSSGFTGQLFDSMRAGTLLRIEGPLGQFWFRGESPRLPLFIGGGTGLCAAACDVAAVARPGRSAAGHALLGCARDAADLYEHNWLLNVAASGAGFDYRPVLSDADAGDRGTVVSGSCTRRCCVTCRTLAAFDVYASGPPANDRSDPGAIRRARGCRASSCTSIRSITRRTRWRRCASCCDCRGRAQWKSVSESLRSPESVIEPEPERESER